MKFVLSGVETNNKGAELMLYAILQEIERRFPDSTVYVGINSVYQGLEYLHTSLDLRNKPITNLQRWISFFHLRGIFGRLHFSTLLFDDVYAIKGTDYFLDGSGFHFSDKWEINNREVKRWNLLLSRNKKIGAKVVFLPQAFGPVEKVATKNVLSVVSKYSDIIMPRESVSEDYLLQSGVVDKSKIRKYTDFTSLVDGAFPTQYDYLRGAVCVIPNARMIDKGGTSIDDYICFLFNIIDFTKSLCKKVYLLNHEGKEDERIAYMCREKLGNKVEVVTGLNALEVKGLISSAYLVVSSRFHGVVSALNSCVPCLATSWSHKYEELFKDYKQNGCVLSLGSYEDAIGKVKEFMDPSINNRVREELTAIVPQIKKETQCMWDEIWRCQ